MHLVTLGLEPIKEALCTIPVTVFPFALPLNNPLLVILAEFFPGCIGGYASILGKAHHVRLALDIAFGLPGLHGAVCQCPIFIRNDQVVVDAHRATEATTGFAGTHR